MSMPALSRCQTSLLCATLWMTLTVGGITCAAAGSPHDAAPDTIRRHFSIYQGPGEYCAWPSIARAGNGDILVVFTRSEEHLAPDGAILLSRSTDNGQTWLPAQLLLDTPIDDRESGLTTLRDGRLVLHCWSTFHTPGFYNSLAADSYEPQVVRRWISFVTTDRYLGAERFHGASQPVSTDHGRTWSVRQRGKDSVHGGIELHDGSLLVASYREDLPHVGVYRAAAADSSWGKIATVYSPQPDSISFGEPHVLQLPSGRILMMIRATTSPYNDLDPRCRLWETYSDDHGRSWSRPFVTPLWGFPPHLLLLSDSRVLCTYGYRRPPFGQRACVSEDGITWSLEDEVVVRDDAPNHDLGYPASLELAPGKILTVYYQPDVPAGTTQRVRPPDPGRVKPGILGTIWTLPPGR